MTISTRPNNRRHAGGFTLVEVLVAATLSVFVLAGALSAFVFLTTSGFRTSSYNEMEAEVRRGLESFARDTRNASDLHWNSSQSVTLTVNGAPVTYTYDATATSPTYRSLCRIAGDATAPLPGTVLIRNLDPDFAFQRYKLAQAGVSDNTAANDMETKQLQLTLRARRTNVATTGGSNAAVSARYILRNKQVSN